MAALNLEPGAKASRSLEVTPAAIELYAQITGDRNPLHFDERFTAATRFQRLIAQGGIATGLVHALVAMDLPGAGSVFMQQEWKFPRPVYIGDTITAEATVTSVHPRHPIAELAIVVRNQDDEPVLEGTATVYQAQPA